MPSFREATAVYHWTPVIPADFEGQLLIDMSRVWE